MSTSGIGFIGLGIMGEGMAARLLSQGVAGTAEVPLVVWNRTPAKCAALQALFPDKTIVVAESAATVVTACAVTYSMLSTPEASAAVFDAADVGTLAGVTAGKSIIDCATLAEADMVRMKEAVQAKGGYVHRELRLTVCSCIGFVS
jgi:3-hydroxyisobutyrate dehydrogenase-like beta-hydroxyacid dehydrogenase